jgi:hypothetical protein
MSQWEQTGDGAVQTSVLDLAKWDANFDDPKVGGRALLDGLHQRGKLADGKPLDYAAGLMHGKYRGQPTVSHSGGWAGYRAQLLRFPQLATSIAVLCNAASSDPTRLAHQIADVVLEKQLDPAPAPGRTTPAGAATPMVKLSAAELDAWVGRYRELPLGAIVMIARDGEQLTIEAGGAKFPLVPTSKQTFKLAGPEIVFELSGAAPKRKLVIRGQTMKQDYEELVPHTPTPAELAGYAGHYASSEAAVAWTLAVVNGKLVVTAPGIEDGTLAPSVKDELSLPGPGITLAFTRGPRGVTGFTAVSGAVRLRFNRIP